MPIRRSVLLLSLIGVSILLCQAGTARAAGDWLPIDLAELKMTSELLAPGAKGIYLYRQVDRDDNGNAGPKTSLSHALGSLQITKALVGNQKATNQPFLYMFTFTAEKYARPAGSLLLLRPRVLGNWSSGILEKKEPRKYPVEFEGPTKDTDVYEITLPEGFEVDELPLAADADYSFASYHRKTEAKGNVLTYPRTMEIKELSVSMGKLDQSKSFYRVIANNERNTAVLKPAGK